MGRPLRFVFLGLSITSSWGNGHATTYRSLLRALAAAGHRVRFLERDVPWYAAHRDEVRLPGVSVGLYGSLDELDRTYAADVGAADIVIVGSYVPEGRAVGAWALDTARGPVAFYDIDTPITLSRLEHDDTCEYIDRALVRRYPLYLSFTGGPALDRLAALGSPCPRPLYCAVDPDVHRPTGDDPVWDLGYLGTYAADRQPALDALLLQVAARRPESRFVVGGPLYPDDIAWPANVDRIDHLPPGEHSRFYSRQRFTLNLTRDDMRRIGYSPSVRLFEAAACGAAIISDVWEGLGECFDPFTEILPARHRSDVETYLRDSTDAARRDLGSRARTKVLARHTSTVRAQELERLVRDLIGSGRVRRTSTAAEAAVR